ncbi:tRNA (adenosine(37)-N6)-dimethylallyltransferase MiaA [Intrasporangium calvum]|uniref:tRNA dimethylallyltransferase n=1 Tax=Intrasporangium calvum (strain ATCC 23552 / DSM 43043 / JCM 3097 / NBRC 12989 / NCIMB 10167 / NRRL B-3866 / 7 KIP) TaxID=710696 RepID=E6SDM2_INTC7|nr:tRNA (adenosine(37)-N6)-dimethylallyltransferase MiaA [Intrasporangium calvum]ADU48674.1 tRNA delta(2)-isopentenylpyrophosphate transferase [Intrasporangium calvum DSM 43043]
MTAAADLPVIAVVGATATGKSGLALDLAERLDGEVVNADAMQLYRGMDIGTAKLSLTERRGVPHHQLDVLEVTEEASVAAYQRAARADLAAVRGRGRVPILVGGSGLYVRAALDRLEIPPTDPEVRGRLEAQAADLGTDAMYQLLADADPAAARRIQPANVRRIVRALEVIELTGRPFSASMPTREFVEPTTMIGLAVDRPILDARVDARVEQMWRAGLRDEVERLLARGLRGGFTASRAIGYAQAIAVIDGRLTEAAAIAETARATRRYARRQESWFRPDPRVRWVDATATVGVDQVIDLVS